MKTVLILLSLAVPPACAQEDVITAPAVSAPLRMAYEPAPEDVEAVEAPLLVAQVDNQEDPQ